MILICRQEELIIFALHKKYIEDTTGKEPYFEEVVKELYNWSQTQELEQHQTTEQIFKQHTLEDWQEANRVKLLLLQNLLQERFKNANYDQYVLLCEIERIVNTNEIDINEVANLIQKI